MNFFVTSVLLSVLVAEVSSYKTQSALHSIVFTNVPPSADEVHSEYYLGRCTENLQGSLVLHDHLKYQQISNNAVVRHTASDPNLINDDPKCPILVMGCCGVDPNSAHPNLIHLGYVNESTFNMLSLPNCVYIKASSPYGDMVKYNAYKFNVCYVLIVYLHKELYHTMYYEWFIPVEMQPNINWDLYFYYVRS